MAQPLGTPLSVSKIVFVGQVKGLYFDRTIYRFIEEPIYADKPNANTYKLNKPDIERHTIIRRSK